MRRKVMAAVAAVLLAGAAWADVPDVAVDIAPVHSLAARVMQGLGEPALVVRPGSSPHGYAMRPSEAAALERAEVVFFVSGNLTRWFERALEPLASDARTVELLETSGTLRHAFRETALFQPHNEDADHGESPAAEDERHAPEDGGAHVHSGPDPHGWLDPENAKVWMAYIAETLADADPENAETYRANAAAGLAEIDAATARAKALLDPLQGVRFFVYHDAYQYFEYRFGLHAAGAISRSDAAKPGPRRIAELRAAVADMDVVCVFSEPQLNPGLLRTVFEGREVRVAGLDPLGTTLATGPALYPALIEKLARDVAACLGGE